MEELNNGQINGHIDGLFIEANTTMYAEGNFVRHGFDDADLIKEELFGIIKNKYAGLNVFTDVLEPGRILTAVVFFEDADIEILDIKIHVAAGSVFASTKEIDLGAIATVPNIAFHFGYGPRTATVFGNGNTEYEVSVLIRDTYKVKVMANSEEEALRIADEVPIHDWEHPDVLEDKHLEDRRVIRHCRWGNLSVKEV
jgi:hypothetical protein